jgi:hypothetical protein
MAAAIRSGTYNTDGGGWQGPGATRTVALGGPVTLGDRIILHVQAVNQNGGAAPTFTVTDSVNGAGKPYTQDATVLWSNGSNNGRSSIFSLANSGAGTPTVSVVVTCADTNFGGMEVAAFSGLLGTDPGTDGTVGTSGCGTTASSGATAATTAANELVIGVYGDMGEGTTLAPGTGFSAAGKHDGDGVYWQGMLEYKLDSGSSGVGQTATVTGANTNEWVMLCAVYKTSAPTTPGAISGTAVGGATVAGVVSQKVTRFYLPSSSTAPGITPAFHVNWNGQIGTADRVSLSTTKTDTALTDKAITGTAANPGFNLHRQYISGPLAAQTIAGTLAGVIRGLESNTSGNYNLAIAVALVDSTGGNRRNLLVPVAHTATSAPPEFTASALTRCFRDAGGGEAIALTSQTASAGDRLVVEIGARDTSASTAYTCTLRFGDPTATADFALTNSLTTDLDPWIEFSSNILAQGASPSFTGAATGSATVSGQPTASGVHGSAAGTATVSSGLTRKRALAGASAGVATGTAQVSGPTPAYAINSQEPSGVGHTAALSSSPTTLSWSFNNVAGNLLLVGAQTSMGNNATSSAVTGVTYGGQALTRAAFINWGTSKNEASLWYLVNPPTGSNTVAVTAIFIGVEANHVTAGAISFSGVNTAAPLGTAVSSKNDTGGSGSASLTVNSTTSGNYVLSQIGTAAGGETATSSTLTWKLDVSPSGGGDNAAMAYAPSSGGNVTLGYAFTSDWWGAQAVEVKAAPAGPGPRDLRGTAAGTATVEGALSGATITGLPFATSVSSNGRCVLDQYGKPYFIQGNSPQCMPVGATTTEMETYFANQAGHGFNSSQVHLIGLTSMNAAHNDSTGRNVAGVAPFANMSTLSTPNETYWTTIDTMFTLAEQYGFTLWASPAENISLGPTVAGMTVAQCNAFGQFIGNRYKGRPNVVWSFGNDWTGDKTAQYKAILQGIRDAGDTHLVITWPYEQQNSWEETDWDTLHSTVMAYTYSLPWWEIEQAYAHVGTGAPQPVFFGEGNYEGENLKTPALTTPETLRRTAWWACTWGGVGHFFGQKYVWHWDAEWSTMTNTSATL